MVSICLQPWQSSIINSQSAKLKNIFFNFPAFLSRTFRHCQSLDTLISWRQIALSVHFFTPHLCGIKAKVPTFPLFTPWMLRLFKASYDFNMLMHREPITFLITTEDVRLKLFFSTFLNKHANFSNIFSIGLLNICFQLHFLSSKRMPFIYLYAVSFILIQLNFSFFHFNKSDVYACACTYVHNIDTVTCLFKFLD